MVFIELTRVSMLHRFLFLCTLTALTGTLCAQSRPATRALPSSITAAARKTVFLSVNPDNVAATIRAVRQMGGAIRFEQDAVGYIRAAMPAARAGALRGSPGVDAIEIEDSAADQHTFDEALQTDDAQSKAALEHAKQAPPIAHPYFASEEIGLERWLKQHPTYDGRGAVIGIVEGAPDFLHPEFGAARTLHGDPVPKFLDVVPISRPNSDFLHNYQSYQSSWIDVSHAVPAENGYLSWRGIRYRVPQSGSYAIGFLHVNIAKIRIIPVLWDGDKRTIRVDTRGGHDFRHAEEIGEYGRTQHFGKIDVAGKMLGYALFASMDGRHIYITLGADFHSTMVTSTAAGTRSRGGLFTGVAPGAQIVSYIVDGYGNYLEGVLSAGADPRTDVVSCSCSFLLRESQTTSPVADHVLARFGEAFHKPLTSASAQAEPAIIGVAPYNDSLMLRRNLEISGSPPAMLAPYPRDDGMIFPDILEPERSLAADSRFLPGGYEAFLRAPEGYMIGGGASNATPFAAGMIADLVSAGKQIHTAVHVRSLRAALWSASKFVSLPDEEQRKERLPILQPVWDALRRASRLDIPSFDVRAPITLAGRASGIGGGMLDELTEAGGSSRRTILITQHGGAECCGLLLSHDDGSFAIDEGSSRKIGGVWHVDILEHPRAPGEHIAELDLTDSRTGMILDAVPLTLRAPLPHSAYSTVLSGNGEVTQYIAQLHRPIRLDIRVVGENVAVRFRSPDNRFATLTPKSYFGERPSAGIPRSWEAPLLSSRSWRKRGARMYEVVIPPGSGLWSLWMARNSGAGDFGRPGPYRPGSPAKITVDVH